MHKSQKEKHETLQQYKNIIKNLFKNATINNRIK